MVEDTTNTDHALTSAWQQANPHRSAAQEGKPVRSPSCRAARTEEDEAAVATQSPSIQEEKCCWTLCLNSWLCHWGRTLVSKYGDGKGWDTLRRGGVIHGKVKTSVFGMNELLFTTLPSRRWSCCRGRRRSAAAECPVLWPSPQWPQGC